MNLTKTCLLVLLFSLSFSCKSQESGIIQVSSINQDVLVLNNYRESEGSLRMYEKIMIVQTENSNVQQVVNKNGNGGGEPVARKYVVVTITDLERADGVIKWIRISSNLQNSFV